VIEDAGFTIIDDLVHGYGGGYLPPVLGTRSRPAGTVPDFTYEEGMVAVIQPNVTTPTGRPGSRPGSWSR
jgi:Xaa-Pro dipeptidase